MWLFFLLAATLHAASAQSASRPNFVIIYTDDQDVLLDGMTPMENLRRLVIEQGIEFTNSFTVAPVCCPSRSSFLTGQYVHNHGTRNNSISGGCYNAAWREIEKVDTLQVVMKAGGYSTFYGGKYLNFYGVASDGAGGTDTVPAGWDDWHGMVRNSKYYNYTLSHNGVAQDYTTEYFTDVLNDLSLEYLQKQTADQPFFMVIAPPAPHAPFAPAPRHEGFYANVTAKRTPNFNVYPEKKHWLLSMPPSPLPEDVMPKLDEIFSHRWETLLAVDELVRDVVEELETLGLLDNTYIIYTSDNGYHVGQFTQVSDKRQPYEYDIRVPLVIRGPNIEQNVTKDMMITNIDLAPTIISLANLEVPERMDGKVIDLNDDSDKERIILISYTGEGDPSMVDDDCPWKYDEENLFSCKVAEACKCQDSRNNTYNCVRELSTARNFIYCQFTDQDHREVYDIGADPYQLDNLSDSLDEATTEYFQDLLQQMLACSSDDCRAF